GWPPMASRRPSGVNATCQTRIALPNDFSKTVRPVSMSHTRTPPFQSIAANHLLSGEKSVMANGNSPPDLNAASSLRVWRSQTRSTLGWLILPLPWLAANSLPFGEIDGHAHISSFAAANWPSSAPFASSSFSTPDEE